MKATQGEIREKKIGREWQGATGKANSVDTRPSVIVRVDQPGIFQFSLLIA